MWKRFPGLEACLKSLKTLEWDPQKQKWDWPHLVVLGVFALPMHQYSSKLVVYQIACATLQNWKALDTEISADQSLLFQDVKDSVANDQIDPIFDLTQQIIVASTLVTSGANLAKNLKFASAIGEAFVWVCETVATDFLCRLKSAPEQVASEFRRLASLLPRAQKRAKQIFLQVSNLWDLSYRSKSAFATFSLQSGDSSATRSNNLTNSANWLPIPSERLQLLMDETTQDVPDENVPVFRAFFAATRVLAQNTTKAYKSWICQSYLCDAAKLGTFSFFSTELPEPTAIGLPRGFTKLASLANTQLHETLHGSSDTITKPGTSKSQSASLQKSDQILLPPPRTWGLEQFWKAALGLPMTENFAPSLFVSKQAHVWNTEFVAKLNKSLVSDKLHSKLPACVMELIKNAHKLKNDDRTALARFCAASFPKCETWPDAVAVLIHLGTLTSQAYALVSKEKHAGLCSWFKTAKKQVSGSHQIVTPCKILIRQTKHNSAQNDRFFKCPFVTSADIEDLAVFNQCRADLQKLTGDGELTTPVLMYHM